MLARDPLFKMWSTKRESWKCIKYVFQIWVGWNQEKVETGFSRFKKVSERGYFFKMGWAGLETFLEKGQNWRVYLFKMLGWGKTFFFWKRVEFREDFFPKWVRWDYNFVVKGKNLKGVLSKWVGCVGAIRNFLEKRQNCVWGEIFKNFKKVSLDILLLKRVKL